MVTDMLRISHGCLGFFHSFCVGHTINYLEDENLPKILHKIDMKHGSINFCENRATFIEGAMLIDS